jgi:hypothetical protein
MLFDETAAKKVGLRTEEVTNPLPEAQEINFYSIIPADVEAELCIRISSFSASIRGFPGGICNQTNGSLLLLKSLP